MTSSATTPPGSPPPPEPDPWGTPPLEWVPLGGLLERVERETGIQPAEAGPVLRLAIMRGASPGFPSEPGTPIGVPHRVEVIRSPGRPSNSGKWASPDDRFVYVSVRELRGWEAVDWKTGTVPLYPRHTGRGTLENILDRETGEITFYPTHLERAEVEVGWPEALEVCRRLAEQRGAAGTGRAAGAPHRPSHGGTEPPRSAQRPPSPARRDGRAAPARRGPQRPDFQEDDARLEAEIDSMVAEGLADSPTAAASLLYAKGRVKARGKDVNAVKRVVKRYYERKRGA